MSFVKIIGIFLLAFSPNLITAQSNLKYGYADTSIPELSQFEYYKGEWEAKMEMKQEDGSFKKLDVVATIVEKFLADHKTFQTIFTTPEGFFSTDIRSFNTTTKKWDALFLNANDQRWQEFNASIVDGKMTTIVLKGYSGRENFDIKVVDTIISENYFTKDVFYSYDGMKTFELVYKMYLTKNAE